MNEKDERTLKDLDISSWDYIMNYPDLPMPSTICKECNKKIKVFSFLDGLCARCYKKRIEEGK